MGPDFGPTGIFVILGLAQYPHHTNPIPQPLPVGHMSTGKNRATNNKSSYYGKNKSTRGGEGNPYGVPSKIKAVKSTASALDISTIDGGRTTMIRRNKQRNHGFTTQTEKRPWWQRSVTHVFSNVDLEMPDTNTIEFDQYMKNHYNV